MSLHRRIHEAIRLYLGLATQPFGASDALHETTEKALRWILELEACEAMRLRAGLVRAPTSEFLLELRCRLIQERGRWMAVEAGGKHHARQYLLAATEKHPAAFVAYARRWRGRGRAAWANADWRRGAAAGKSPRMRVNLVRHQGARA